MQLKYLIEELWPKQLNKVGKQQVTKEKEFFTLVKLNSWPYGNKDRRKNKSMRVIKIPQMNLI
jgi:hypothetical protein